MINPVFVNKDCFKSEFVPDRIIGREKQIEEIKRKINLDFLPILHIYGLPGSGKTVVVKHIFKNISNSVYVNCWERSTYREIFEEILRKSNIVVHEKESRFSLLQKLRRVPKKIICLDNAEHLADIRVISDLAQFSDSLILISNIKHFLTHSNRKILDRIASDYIQFEKYDYQDIMKILERRMIEGLNSGSIETRMFSKIIKLCNGDASKAIQTLGIAAAKAEEYGREIVTDDVLYGIKCVVTNHFSFLINRLNSHQKILYEILKQQKCIPSGKLYREYRSNMKETVTDRCYRKYMKGLIKLELAREISSGRWKRYEII